MSANMMYRLAAHSYFKQSAVEKTEKQQGCTLLYLKVLCGYGCQSLSWRAKKHCEQSLFYIQGLFPQTLSTMSGCILQEHRKNRASKIKPPID